MENINEIFETTKRGIKEILQNDHIKKISKFVYKENEYPMEQEDITEMLKYAQAINLGIIDKVTVKDIHGNEYEMDKDEYVQRNLVGLKQRTIEQLDLEKLNKIVDGIETFTEFVNFENLETAKEYFLPKPEVKEEPKVEEEPPYEGDMYPLPEEPEVVEDEIYYDIPAYVEEEPVEENK